MKEYIVELVERLDELGDHLNSNPHPGYGVCAMTMAAGLGPVVVWRREGTRPIYPLSAKELALQGDLSAQLFASAGAPYIGANDN